MYSINIAVSEVQTLARDMPLSVSALPSLAASDAQTVARGGQAHHYQNDLFNGGQFHRATITVWEKSNLAFAGDRVANKATLDSVEKLSELFANAFLSANPKSP